MSDDQTPESEFTKWLRHYRNGEGVFDDFLGWLTGSAWSLAIFIVYTLAAVAFGFWVGK